MNAPSRDVRRRELGGPDPLDRRLGDRPPAPVARFFSLLRTRSALGLAPSLTPAVIFLPLGVLLGPQVLGVLSPGVLERLDVAVTVALAVLGVIVGAALGRELRTAILMTVAASLESFITIAAVAAATAYFAVATSLPLGGSVVAMALALGLCASASSATSADPDLEPAAGVSTRVADLDDVLPIVVAAFTFAWLPTGFERDPWMATLLPLLAGLAVGVIGWLLFERAESGAERTVFVLGALALAGGVAAYARVSPLAVGLIAGYVWTVAPGRADQIARDDLAKVQHPLVVLLLVSAGALWVPSLVAVWLAGPFLLFRVAGKVAGAWVSSRLVDVRAGDLAAFLMPPGVLAIALALNVRQILPSEAGEILLSTVAMGTAAFELFGLAVVPRWRPRMA